MCAELLRIPIEYRGVPLFGFGVLLILWAAAGAYGAYCNARAGRPLADGWLTFVVGVAAIVVLPRFFPNGFPLRGYGLMLLCGSVAGLAMAIHRGRQQGVAPETIVSLAMGMFICGIIGARLFYVIEYWPTRIRQPTLMATLAEALSYTEGGLVVYGSLIGAAAAFLWFCLRHNLPPLSMADMIAPSLAAGLAFGRIGCLLNGCCYGGETDAPYAITFPRWSIPPSDGVPGRMSGAYFEQYGGGRYHGLEIDQIDNAAVVRKVTPGSPAAEAGVVPGDKIVGVDGFAVQSAAHARQLIDDAFRMGRPAALNTPDGIRKISVGEPPPRSRPVHPTQIYSAINAALLAWLLWSFYPLRRIDGQVTALMLTAYPVARFMLEEIRIDESPVFGTNLSISQNISLALLVAAALLWGYLRWGGVGRYDFALARWRASELKGAR